MDHKHWPIQLLSTSGFRDYPCLVAQSFKDAMCQAWNKYPDAKAIRVRKNPSEPTGWYELNRIGAFRIGYIGVKTP